MIRLKKLLEQTYSAPKTGTSKKLQQQSPIKNLAARIFDLIISPTVGSRGIASSYVDAEYRGINIYNEFAEIVNRRIKYNKKNNLPLNKPTQEETSYRQKLYKAAPSFGYTNVTTMFNIISDIEQGNQSSQDLRILKDIETNLKSKNPKHVEHGKRLQQYYNSRMELKSMALGLDAVNGLSKGYWVKSDFKPQKGKDGKTTIYIRPAKIPVLNTKQFDTLYNLILLTKVGGKFPGGNSQTVSDRLDTWTGGKSSVNVFNNDQRWMLFGNMGTFKFGCGEENGTSFISVYDLWDLAPDFYNILPGGESGSSGKAGTEKSSVDLTQFLHAPEIYYRIYRPEPGKALVPLNYTKYSKDGKVKK
jgi:hypothetical protein